MEASVREDSVTAARYCSFILHMAAAKRENKAEIS